MVFLRFPYMGCLWGSAVKSCHALWNSRPEWKKLPGTSESAQTFFLQTLGKPASHLQALDRELKVPRTFAHFRWEAAHTQAGAQSGKS